MTPNRERLVLTVITLVILGVFWMALGADFLANESYDYRCCYEPAARNWMSGKGFAYNDGNFASAYPPGFSVLLAGVFLIGKVIGDGSALYGFIALCTIASVLAMYSIGRAMGGVWLGRISALCLMTYPYFLWMSKQPNSEVPYLALILWAFYAFVRLLKEASLKWAALCGAFLALSALVRPISIFAAFIMAGCLLLFVRNRPLTQRLLLGVVLVAANIATIMPWEIIAKQGTGRWILIGNNSGVGYYDGLTFGLPNPARPASQVPPDVLALMQRADAQAERISTSGGYLSFLKEEAQSHPAAFARLMYIKITRAWYATYEGRFESINKLVEGAYILATLAGLWLMRRKLPVEAWTIVAMVLYYWAMSVLVLPILRYMVPATALMLLAVAFLLRAMAERWGLLRGYTGK